jgi:hypothetical protein
MLVIMTWLKRNLEGLSYLADQKVGYDIVVGSKFNLIAVSPGNGTPE